MTTRYVSHKRCYISFWKVALTVLATDMLCCHMYQANHAPVHLLPDLLPNTHITSNHCYIHCYCTVKSVQTLCAIGTPR